MKRKTSQDAVSPRERKKNQRPLQQRERNEIILLVCDTKPHAMTTFEVFSVYVSHFCGHWSCRFGNRDIRLYPNDSVLMYLWSCEHERRHLNRFQRCENRANRCPFHSKQFTETEMVKCNLPMYKFGNCMRNTHLYLSIMDKNTF